MMFMKSLLDLMEEGRVLAAYIGSYDTYDATYKKAYRVSTWIGEKTLISTSIEGGGWECAECGSNIGGSHAFCETCWNQLSYKEKVLRNPRHF